MAVLADCSNISYFLNWNVCLHVVGSYYESTQVTILFRRIKPSCSFTTCTEQLVVGI